MKRKKDKINSSIKIKKLSKIDLRIIYGGGWGEEFLKWFYPKNRDCENRNINKYFQALW